MAILNFKCKKCENGFDLNIGRVKFSDNNRIQMERKPICPLCEKSSENVVVLSELNKERLQNLYDQSIRKKVLRRVRPGQILSYPSIFGSSSIIQLSFQENYFYVYDNYCVNPICECSDVILDFNTKGAEYLSPYCKIVYDYKLDTVKETDLNDEEAQEIIVALLSKDKEIFYKRHQELKKEVMINISRKLFKNSIAKIKVGRNEPCPCGSGKKYKKCCLIKET